MVVPKCRECGCEERDTRDGDDDNDVQTQDFLPLTPPHSQKIRVSFTVVVAETIASEMEYLQN